METEKYKGYGWIKVKHLPDDEFQGEQFVNEPELCGSYYSARYVDWLEERLDSVETHHVEETTFLIEEIRKLAARIDSQNASLSRYRKEAEQRNNYNTRQARWDSDYVPYHEDDYDR